MDKLKKLRNGKCSPHRINDSTLYKCFSKHELVKIAKSYNSFTEICKEDTCYKVKTIEDIDKMDTETLHKILSKRLSKLCKDEHCWLNLSFIEEIPDKEFVENLKYFVFKPKMYGNRWKWLSTLDINYVLKQYEKFDPHFLFLGAQPADFLNLVDEKSLLETIRNDNVKKIGLVMNWDTHKGSGSHWVAIFIDKKENSVEYFDSTGDSPKENKHILKTLGFLMKYLGKKELKINKNVHQRGNSECGIYSIYFIIQRIINNDFDSVTNAIIHDDKMNLFRDFIFIMD
jgi:hypothetical protein